MSLEMHLLWYTALDAAPGVRGGRVRARGTRLTVRLIREDLEGSTPGQLKSSYPGLTEEHPLAVQTCSTRALRRIRQRAR